MSRELKRVPLDFNWPLDIVWKGYMNPYDPIECKLCDGSGLNKKTKKLSDDWYTHSRTDDKEGWGHNLNQEDVQALIDAGRLMDFTRVPRTPEQVEIVKKKVADGGNSWLPTDNGYIPTAEEVNKWSRNGFGHDTMNKWICVEARAKRLGFYGKCPLCKGDGHYWCEEKYEELYESWEQIEPPKGEGYQLWENCSEGSPISPVFKSLDELCAWAEDNATTFGSSKTTKENWKKMLNEDHVYHQEGNMIFT